MLTSTPSSTPRAATSATAMLVAAVLLALATPTSAQVASAFQGTSFPVSSFSVSQTFTPVTTFAQATGGNPTVIGGPGPSPATSSYQFTYTVPTATVPATAPTQVYASLASSAGYNTASDAKNLVPNPNNLQIVNGAVGVVSGAAAKAVCVTVLAAVLVVLVL